MSDTLLDELLEKRSRGDVALKRRVEPRPLPVKRASAPTAKGRYPADAELIAALRANGIKRIYGIYDLSAWYETTSSAKLYMLPFSTRARANISGPGGITFRANHLQRNSNATISMEYAIGRVIEWCIREGHLLQALFPDFREYQHGDDYVTVRLPAPPRSELATITRARLAGLGLHVAAPATAIHVSDVAGAANAAWQKELLERDPIIVGVRDKRAVVLGYYGQSEDDPEEMQVLTEILASNRIDL